jgi:Ca-activated chloride channel family protein
MRFLVVAAFLGLAGAVLGQGGPGNVLGGGVALAQQPTFRSSDTVIVPVPTTVVDKEGRLVPNLEREHFSILDNGKPQEIVVFQNSVEPFTAVVMLDFSASMTNHLELLKEATEQFILRMLRTDRAQVGAFSDKIQFSGTFTSDRDDLIFALRDLQFGNPTRLYDAIYESQAMLVKETGRKVVVVFTDGEDTYSKRSFGDVLDRARQENVMIYAIGLESEMAVGGRIQRSRPDRSLKRLAEETGGGYFELKKTAELAPTFTRVVQELHSLYSLGFAPAALDGKEHRVEVRVSQAGMQARARRTYVATAEALGTR